MNARLFLLTILTGLFIGTWKADDQSAARAETSGTATVQVNALAAIRQSQLHPYQRQLQWAHSTPSRTR